MFITVLDGAVVIRPLAARAQETRKAPRIGVLYPVHQRLGCDRIRSIEACKAVYVLS